MSELTFEQSLQQLEQIVSQLERGDVPLEEALSAFLCSAFSCRD